MPTLRSRRVATHKPTKARRKTSPWSSSAKPRSRDPVWCVSWSCRNRVTPTSGHSSGRGPSKQRGTCRIGSLIIKSISRLSVALIMVAAITSPVCAQNVLPRHARVAIPEQSRAELTLKERINASTIGLAAGRTEGAPLQFAAELARVLDDGDNMRVLPIVTRGPFDNVFDLLYLRGVDAAIVYGDVLDHFSSKPDFASAARCINYLFSLFPSEVHVFVRPEINSMQALAGKVVNFNTSGTAAAFTGPIVLKQLGIEVKATFIPHSVAMEKMRQGDEVAATFWVSSKPLAPFLKGKWAEGFKFLPIEYNDKLEYYSPGYPAPTDSPTPIKAGQRIPTISVPAVLAVYDWPKGSDRYKRLVRMVDYLFDRLPRLQNEPGYHDKWKDVNLAA